MDKLKTRAIVNLLKSLIIWLCFIPVAILNGGLREYVLVKVVGGKWALPISGITLSVCIFLLTWFTLPHITKACTSKDGWLMGICWCALTMAFEFVAGLTDGHTMKELVCAYNPLTGNLWLLVIATTFFSPVITGKFSPIYRLSDFGKATRRQGFRE